eukprot:1181494-Prorocentrum_minimum.AAC.1
MDNGGVVAGNGGVCGKRAGERRAGSGQRRGARAADNGGAVMGNGGACGGGQRIGARAVGNGGALVAGGQRRGARSAGNGGAMAVSRGARGSIGNIEICLESEEASQLRSEGSKCLTVLWTQSEAYPLLSQWCESRSKGKPAPNGIAFFLRFVGDGSERGAVRVYEVLDELCPRRDRRWCTRARSCNDTRVWACGNASLKDQQIATQQVTISELKKLRAKDLQELEKVKHAMAVL